MSPTTHTNIVRWTSIWGGIIGAFCLFSLFVIPQVWPEGYDWLIYILNPLVLYLTPLGIGLFLWKPKCPQCKGKMTFKNAESLIWTCCDCGYSEDTGIAFTSTIGPGD